MATKEIPAINESDINKEAEQQYLRLVEDAAEIGAAVVGQADETVVESDLYARIPDYYYSFRQDRDGI